MSLNLNTIGGQINNEKFTAYLKRTILDIWKCKKDIYPSTVPVLLNREDFDKFSKYEYFVTSYLKEKHVQVYFFNDFFNKPTAVICDKLFNFFKINVKCTDEVYLGTLFDCQIKEFDGVYFLYINDCVCMNGNNIKNMVFEYRLGVIENFLNTNPLFTDPRVFFKQKIHYKLKYIGEYIEKITEYNLDSSVGLLFIPNKLPLICGTQKSNMFWLTNSNYSIDLSVNEVEDGLMLDCYNLKKRMNYAKVKSPELVQKIKNMENYSNDCIVEFKISNKTLEPTIVKLDKTYPNGLRVIETVLYTINQNITKEEIEKITAK